MLAIQGVESAPPTIQIHQPLDQMTRRSHRSVRLAGTALDDRRLLGWAWSLNRGPWQTVRLRLGRSTSWNGKVRGLERGRNSIEIRAYDASGNLSTARRRIVRVR